MLKTILAVSILSVSFCACNKPEVGITRYGAQRKCDGFYRKDHPVLSVFPSLDEVRTKTENACFISCLNDGYTTAEITLDKVIKTEDGNEVLVNVSCSGDVRDIIYGD